MNLFGNLRCPMGAFLLFIIIYLLNIFTIQHIGLSADGAHYALYATHLSFGYVDHPPLIGWLQGFIIFCFGKHDFALHCLPLIFSFLTLIVIFRLSSILNIQNNYIMIFCFISVVWNALTFLAITQAPLIFFCLLSCYLFYRWLASSSFIMSFGLGLSLGLAGLSDYSAFIVALGLVVYLGIYQPKKIVSPQWLFTVFIALLCVTPFLWWNDQHHWISFTAGYDHSFSGSFSWHWFGQAVVMQLLGYSPALVIFGLIGSIKAIQTKNAQQSLLSIPGLMVIAIINFAGLHHKIFFHWPALGWMIIAPLAYQNIKDNWENVWTKVIVLFSMVLSALVYIIFYLEVFFAPLTFDLGKNPLIDLYGWKAIGREARLLAKQSGQTHPVLFVPNWSLASRLAWYSDLPVQILQPSPIAGYKQFVMWFGQPTKDSQGILVVPYPWEKPAANSPCAFIQTIPVLVHQKLMNEVSFYKCASLI